MPAGSDGRVDLSDSKTNEQSRALNQFLAGVELKGFKIARAGLRNDDDALDAVQDAMLQLARAYPDRPPEEWRPLFFRILGNRIRDLQRRRSVRNRFMAWLPFRRDAEDQGEDDPLDRIASEEPLPEARLEMRETIGALESAVRALPHRQQQAFLLRNLEGLDVAQTAEAMGCSEGSVKTHYFRALQSLRAALGELPT